MNGIAEIVGKEAFTGGGTGPTRRSENLTNFFNLLILKLFLFFPAVYANIVVTLL